MATIHDFYTTLGSIIGAEIPTDRAVDGVDQTDFFLGKQENSNRESVITFLGDEIVAVRWKRFRIYRVYFDKSETCCIIGERGLRKRFRTFNVETDNGVVDAGNNTRCGQTSWSRDRYCLQRAEQQPSGEYPYSTTCP